MRNSSTTTHTKRVNITLPEETLLLIDRLAKKGTRSTFLDQAAHFYIKEVGRAHLRDHLRRGARIHASRDRSLAEEWFSVDEELWQSKAGA